jgi:predicted GNAT family acetyltransferase
MPAAVMAATEIEPMARCKTAAINQASKYVLRLGRIAFVHTEVYESYGGMGLGGRLARTALDDARPRICGNAVLPVHRGLHRAPPR